ncbi:MAG TPA: 4-alpha-glucanotransferase [Candidatus Binataceae bacterium]|nr:4-alpha-glucanotransferase [Candidatus Binataceae bacterium]
MLPRVAGVLIPLFSLRTLEDLGRGEIFGLTPMVNFARDMGLALVQLLPLDECAPEESSPYSAMSVFAMDPVYISARGLKGVGRVSLANSLQKIAATQGPIRSAVRPAKLALLDRAWRASPERVKRSAQFDRFIAENRDWLDDYALFRVLKDRFAWSPWEKWPAELRGRDPHALEAARSELADPITRYSWFQFIAHRQWSAMRAYAAENRVMLGGDMAFSPAHDSAEVWANQVLFDLERTVGAPPDAFNERGQRWGLPLPKWDAMRADGFKLWRTRARRAAAMYDVLRVDHVVGLFRTFSFGKDPDAPGSFVPAEEHAQRAQGDEILRALREAAGGCELIAEDLGSVPPWVRVLLTALGIPGYKVMQWEREWDAAGERFLKPAAYPELSLATTGTHDTETLATWWERQSAAEREKLVEALEIRDRADPNRPLDETGLDAILRSLYASPARLVVPPIQDLFGWNDQINRPGTISDTNWSYRLPFALEQRGKNSQIQSRVGKLRALAVDSGRVAGTTKA